MTSERATALVEKTMSLAPHEFVTGCQRLADDGDAVGERSATLAVGSGSVEITYEPLGSVRLGGLLELPRAKVRLNYIDVATEDQLNFTKKFEIAFQRGGG